MSCLVRQPRRSRAEERGQSVCCGAMAHGRTMAPGYPEYLHNTVSKLLADSVAGRCRGAGDGSAIRSATHSQCGV
jgi:hypothetical protein